MFFLTRASRESAINSRLRWQHNWFEKNNCFTWEPIWFVVSFCSNFHWSNISIAWCERNFFPSWAKEKHVWNLQVSAGLPVIGSEQQEISFEIWDPERGQWHIIRHNKLLLLAILIRTWVRLTPSESTHFTRPVFFFCLSSSFYFGAAKRAVTGSIL